jgi:HSP20 family protein
MLRTTTRGNGISDMAREMERTFDALAREFTPIHSVGTNRTSPPALNVWQDERAMHVELEAPGFGEDQIDVTISGDTVTISGEREQVTPDGAQAVRVERSLTKFSRALTLPFEIDQEKVDATLESGVLRLTLPKAESELPRKVAVRALKRPDGQDPA